MNFGDNHLVDAIAIISEHFQLPNGKALITKNEMFVKSAHCVDPWSHYLLNTYLLKWLHLIIQEPTQIQLIKSGSCSRKMEHLRITTRISQPGEESIFLGLPCLSCYLCSQQRYCSVRSSHILYPTEKKEEKMTVMIYIKHNQYYCLVFCLQVLITQLGGNTEVHFVILTILFQ